MTHSLIKYAASLLIAIAAPVSATLGLPEVMVAPELAATLTQSAPSADQTLPALAAFDELIQAQSGELQVFRWSHAPQVFVFIYPDLETQARSLNRIAAFVEKSGAPRDRILTDEELSTVIQASGKTAATYYVGHDYTAAALADFFNTARHSSVPLNSQEQNLQIRLLRFGFFSQLENGQLAVLEPERVLLSVAPEPSPLLSASDQRLKLVSLLRHELSHAEFFVNPAYREYCLSFWNALPDDQRRIFTQELAEMGYDTANIMLLSNEFQAFLWEPLRGAFIDIRLQKAGSSLASVRMDFIEKLRHINPSVTAIFTIPSFTVPITWQEQVILSKTSEVLR